MTIKPSLRLLSETTVKRIVAEAYDLLQEPGVRIHSDTALELLDSAGATVDKSARVAHIPPSLVDRAVESAPSSFYLYDADGRPAVHYGDDDVHFDPGSAAIKVLDHGQNEARPPVTADLVRYAKLAHMLPQIDAVSTSMVCSDVPKTVADLYRLYLVLLLTSKPIVTGAFAVETWSTMKDLLVAVAGSEEALASKPRAVFDVCPSPPLLWSDITCENLMDCARYGVPAELVSMPLAGATGPATLVGSVVQHAAENLSGVTIHQLVKPGSPIVWGGSPAAFDMRTGTTPMGAVETMMIDMAYAQVGKHLGFPTHAYMGMSDTKILDTQTGFESGHGTLLASLAGINMVSGAGMMDFESCFSLEKLVIDCEIIDQARRLLRGIDDSEDPLALGVMRAVGHTGNFLAHEHTRSSFRREQVLPSAVVDRDFRGQWEAKGCLTAAQRAHARVAELVEAYAAPGLSTEIAAALQEITLGAFRASGLDALPAA
jgi:trimethylamine--corrinoid protein Co-methyltransferase